MADTFPLLMTSLLFQLDKGISYLAPMFLDYVICSGLTYDLMSRLESCLPHTTTRPTINPSEELSPSTRSSPLPALVLAPLLLLLLLAIQ